VARRSLVRTGVTAAWAVPVVTVAAAAPAFAVCSGTASLGASTFASPARTMKEVTVSVTLRNAGSTSSGLKLAVSNSGGGTLDSVKATGWSTATADRGGAASLVSVAGTQLACGGAPLATKFTVQLHSGSPNQTLAFVFTTNGGVGYTFTITV